MLYASILQQVTPPRTEVTGAKTSALPGVDPTALSELADAKPTPPATPPGWERLDSYRRNILCLTAHGLTNAQIGEKLCKSEKTITNRKTEIIDELGLKNASWHCLSDYVATHQVFLRQQPFLADRK
jgi:DNA-binding NarL/FixJ family response regulator